jgi:hypothetical protein
MKHFSFLLLSVAMITFTLHTNCMLLALRSAKRPLQLPQQKRFCSHPVSLEQRVTKLEDEVALMKSILAKQSNNNQTPLNDENLPCIYKPSIEYKWDRTLYGHR